MLKNLILNLFFINFLFSQVEVSATVDSKEIYTYENINFKITVNQSEGFPIVKNFQFNDFEILSGPSQSSSFQWINGNMLSKKSLSWTISPKKTGDLLIPKFEINIDGKKFFTNEIQIKVYDSDNRKPLKQNANQKSPIIFIVAEPEKQKLVKGEQVNVEYKLYSKANLRQYSFKAKPKGQGFWREELYEPKQPKFKEIDYNGEKYNVSTIYRIALFPTNIGELKLDQLILSCSIQTQSSRKDFSLFDDFFNDSFFSRTQEKIISSNSVTFLVEDIPQENKPLNFSGAVGTFTFSSSVDTNVVMVNEPLTFNLKLSGTGNLDLFEIIEPDFPSGLEVFPPKSSFVKDPFRDKISGVKTWEYIIIPRNAEEIIIPSIEISFFNPITANWESSKTDKINIQVLANQNLFSKNKSIKNQSSFVNKELRYINEDKIRFTKDNSSNLIPNIFWIINIISIMILIFPYVSKDSNNLFRTEIAFSKKAKDSILKIKNEDFSILHNIIFGFFANRFNIPVNKLNIDIIKIELLRFLDQKDVSEIIDILKTCEEKKFSIHNLTKINFDQISSKMIDYIVKIDKSYD